MNVKVVFDSWIGYTAKRASNIATGENMSSSENEEVSRLKSGLENLISEWEGQVKEFRRLSLAATDSSERSRMRAKADTKHYSLQELKLVLEEYDENEKSESNNCTWPSLGMILGSKK